MLEDDGYYISLASHEEFTRDDIPIEYQPGDGVTNYSYTITKDGKSGETFYIPDNSLERIVLEETGTYTIEFVNEYQDGHTTTFKTGIYNVDKEAPRLEIKKNSYQIEAGSTFNVMGGVRATDTQSGNLTYKVETNVKDIDFDTLGKKEVTYRVTDEAGNTTMRTIVFEVVPSKREELLLGGCVVIGILALLVLLIVRYYRTILLEKRIGHYSLEPVGKRGNFFDRVLEFKDGIVEAFAKRLRKYNSIVYYCKRYEKYQIAFMESSTVNFFAQKLLMSIFFFAFVMLASTLRLEVLDLTGTIFALLLGFFLPDLIYFIRYRFYRNHVENDLLQAIIIMNNAFKSGHSIPQAVEIVAQELEGDIHEEFARMHKELSMGLSVEEVFRRFAQRIEITEVTYLTSSLSILNRTGGNIIKVFSSIEKTLMNKKKLRLEMKALTSSAKLVSYLLMVLPALFVVGISFISPDYFLPLVSNVMGWLVLIVIILVYCLYVYAVRRIMKVRM